MSSKKSFNTWLKNVPRMRGNTRIDWIYILQHIPMDKKIEAGEIVLENMDLFDGDYQVNYDGNVLRFLQTMAVPDINKLRMDVYLMKVTVDEYNKIMRDIGYSFCGYRDVRLTEDSF